MMTVETLAFASRRQLFSALCGIYGGAGTAVLSGRLLLTGYIYIELELLQVGKYNFYIFIQYYKLHIFSVYYIYI